MAAVTEIHIPLNFTVLLSSSTSYAASDITKGSFKLDMSWLDTDDIDYIVVRSTLSAEASGSDRTVYGELYNHTDGASVSGSEVSDTGTAARYVPKVTGDIKAQFAGNDVYTFRVKTSNADTTVGIQDVVIIIGLKSGFTKCFHPIFLGDIKSTQSVSYIDPDNVRFGLYTQTNYSGTRSFEYHSVLGYTGVFDQAYVRLYDATNSSQTAVLTSFNTSEYKTTSVGSLTNGAHYKIQLKTGASRDTARVWGAYLIIKQDGSGSAIDDTEQELAVLPYGTLTGVNESYTTPTTEREYYDPNAYGGTKNLYWDNSVKAQNFFGATTHYHEVFEVDVGALGGEVSSSDVTNTWHRIRSNAMTEPSTAMYLGRHSKWAVGGGGFNTWFNSIGRLIVVQTGLAPTATTTPLLTLMGVGT